MFKTLRLLLAYTYLHCGSWLGLEHTESGELGYRWWRLVFLERYFQLRQESPKSLKDVNNPS